MEEIDLTKQAYEKHGVKYSIYEGNNRFYGTPVPEGYKAIYVNDGIIPSSLKLERIENQTEDIEKHA